MSRILVALLTLAAAVHAADVTGTWSGPMTMTRGEETKDDSAYLVLKQTGNEITGTAGPNAERQMPIVKGTATGDSLVLEVSMEGDNKLVIRLKTDGDKLVGDLKAEGPTAPPLSGKMTLTKEAAKAEPKAK